MMTVKPFAILSVATAAALSLAGCGDRVEDHAERTGNAIAADVHAATSANSRTCAPISTPSWG